VLLFDLERYVDLLLSWDLMPYLRRQGTRRWL